MARQHGGELLPIQAQSCIEPRRSGVILRNRNCHSHPDLQVQAKMSLHVDRGFHWGSGGSRIYQSHHRRTDSEQQRVRVIPRFHNFGTELSCISKLHSRWQSRRTATALRTLPERQVYCSGLLHHWPHLHWHSRGRVSYLIIIFRQQWRCIYLRRNSGPDRTCHPAVLLLKLYSCCW